MGKVAFLGLGVMGGPMAGFLAKAGHQVSVYNRSRAKGERWVSEYKGQLADTAAEASRDAEFVFACVGNDDDLREVTTGPKGAFSTMVKDGVFADHTTVSAEVSREVYAAARSRGLHFLDAPVSGGQVGAEKGVLTMMVGGDEPAFTRTEPLLRNYAKTIQYMGPSGNGQLTKMVNQICIAGIVQSLAEAMNFALAAGLEIDKVVPTISKGAAGSWQMDNRAGTMTEGRYNFGFAVDWLRKDLGICLDEAKRNGATLPVTALIDQFYADIQRIGGNRWDTSSLIQRLSHAPKINH